MPTYLIEREIPGASSLTDEELRGITATSNDVVAGLSRPYTWRHGYVAGDKVYCVHDAENVEDVLEHACFACHLAEDPMAVLHWSIEMLKDKDLREAITAPDGINELFGPHQKWLPTALDNPLVTLADVLEARDAWA